MSHFKHTEERKFEVRLIVSNQISEMLAAPNMLATGKDWRIVSASSRTSEHKSTSSPDLHARFRKANAKDRAVREPIWAKPAVAADPDVLDGELENNNRFHKCGMHKHINYNLST